MKTIYFFSSDGFPSKKNPVYGIFTYEQAKALKNKNKILIDFQSNRKTKIFLDSRNGLKIYRLLYTKYNILKIFKNLLFLNKLFLKNKPDLIICSFLNLRNILYSYFFNFDLITIIHGSDAVCKGVIKKKIVSHFLKKNKKIITVSNYTKKIFFSNFNDKSIKDKVSVVYNGISKDKLKLIDKKFVKSLKKKKKKIITCVANLVPRKNIQYLIEIFYILNQNNPNKFHLYIAGDGSEKSNILELISKLKLTKDVTLNTNLSDREISSILHVSKIFCLFSKNYKHEFEGFGIVIIEAMFAKSIVFASQHGGMQELVKNNVNGFSFNLRTSKPNLIAKKIELVSKNKNIKKRIISKAHNFSSNFSWKKNIETILSYINQ